MTEMKEAFPQRDELGTASLRIELHAFIEPIVDAFAAFDGRFSVTPSTQQGLCLLTFTTARERWAIAVRFACRKRRGRRDYFVLGTRRTE